MPALNPQLFDEPLKLQFCPDCRNYLGLEYFAKNPKSRTGHYTYCKFCSRLRRQMARRGNPAYLAHIRDRRAAKRLKAIEMLGGKCCMCGFLDERALTFDHKAGDGWIDRLENNNDNVLAVFRAPEKFQLLCANCHIIKTKEAKEFSQNALIKACKLEFAISEGEQASPDYFE